MQRRRLWPARLRTHWSQKAATAALVMKKAFRSFCFWAFVARFKRPIKLIIAKRVSQMRPAVRMARGLLADQKMLRVAYRAPRVANNRGKLDFFRVL